MLHFLFASRKGFNSTKHNGQKKQLTSFRDQDGPRESENNISTGSGKLPKPLNASRTPIVGATLPQEVGALAGREAFIYGGGDGPRASARPGLRWAVPRWHPRRLRVGHGAHLGEGLRLRLPGRHLWECSGGRGDTGRPLHKTPQRCHLPVPRLVVRGTTRFLQTHCASGRNHIWRPWLECSSVTPGWGGCLGGHLRQPRPRERPNSCETAEPSGAAKAPEKKPEVVPLLCICGFQVAIVLCNPS